MEEKIYKIMRGAGVLRTKEKKGAVLVHRLGIST